MISNCLHHAIEIERACRPIDWPSRIANVPGECRVEVETYLRGMAKRLRVVRAKRREIKEKDFLQ